jgi:hypothetical protein
MAAPIGLSNSLQHYYKLDESSGNAADSKGSLTLTNTSVTYGAVKINNGAIFNGSANLISGSNIGITGTSARTVAFWGIITGTATTEQYFISWGVNGTGTMWNFGVVNSHWYFSGGNSRDVDTGVTPDNNLHFWCITYDGTTTTIYKDTTSIGSGSPVLNTTDSHLYLGERVLADKPLTGKMDEVGIWTRALTTTEIKQLYNHNGGLQYPLANPSNFLMFM